jgi:Mn2+/Fe2+ NRAMP family transporter
MPGEPSVVEAAREEQARPQPWWRKLTAVGPGLIFVLSIVGPRDLVTNSMAGADYGYALIWLLVVAITARLFILEATARYVIVTGESIVTGCAKAGRWLVWMIFLTPLLHRFMSGMIQMILMGTAIHLVLPLPTPHSVAIWSLISWALAFTLLFWGRYRLVERMARPLAVLMGGSLALAAFLSKPDWEAAVKGAIVPTVPDQNGLYGTAVVILGVVIGAIGSFGNMKYATFVHEKGWRDLSYLRRQRWDLLSSAVGMFVMLALLQIAAAGALHPLGIQVAEVEDLVPVFSQVLGESGRIVLALGIWSVVFTSMVGSSTAYALMLSDLYHRFLRPSAVIREQDEGRGAAYLPAFRWFLVIFQVPALMVLLTDWRPVPLLMFSAAISAVMLPATIIILIRLTADRKFMGEYVNRWFVNVVLVLSALMSLYLGYQSILELFSGGGLH